MESAVAPSPVAARVAERYSRVPSYREMLAARAEAEAQAAAAAAEPPVAAAPVVAQPAAHHAPLAEHSLEPRPEHRPSHSPDLFPEEPAPVHRPYQPDLIRYSVASDSLPPMRTAPVQARPDVTPASRTALAEAVEMVDPLEEAVVEPTRLLPARIIEFPRELIAPRKARPRIAEGPLRDDPPVLEAAVPPPAEEASLPHASTPAQDPAPAPAQESAPGSVDTVFLDSLLQAPEAPYQLRILEAEPEAVAPVEAAAAVVEPPAAELAEPAPEWHSIQLDDDPVLAKAEPAVRSSLLDDLPLHVAPIGDRLMSGVVDMALTLAAFLVFVLVFAACTPHMPAGKAAAAGAGLALLAIFMLYQFIFFRLSGATLGMRYAKIALCTFEDENPTPAAIRMRIASLLLSALPLGLGFLWAVFDEDYLGWHDRITRTYQRSYREL
jgi:uncharacterized RDD family membrane protein YckC